MFSFVAMFGAYFAFGCARDPEFDRVMFESMETVDSTQALFSDYPDAYNDRHELTGSERFLGVDPQSFTQPVPAFDRAYAYDLIGNRKTSQSGGASGPLTTYATYAANALNQYASAQAGASGSNPSAGSGWLFDDDGNLRETYVSSDVDGDGDVDGVGRFQGTLFEITTEPSEQPRPVVLSLCHGVLWSLRE